MGHCGDVTGGSLWGCYRWVVVGMSQVGHCGDVIGGSLWGCHRWVVVGMS